MTHRRTSASLWRLALLSLLLIGALAFWPRALGGNTSLLIISGGSMLPKYESGDLVIVRTTDQYEVGEALAYRHPSIGFVFHRLVAFEDDRLAFRGDNNDYVDPYRPTPADVIGHELMHVPAVGGWLRQVNEMKTIVILVLGAVIGAAIMGHRPLGDQLRRARKGAIGRRISRDLAVTAPHLRALAVIAGVLAAGAAIVGFNRPASVVATTPVAYTQTVAFDYEAASNANAVYDDHVARSGDPLFRRVVDELLVTVHHDVTSPNLPVSGAGNYDVIARVSNSTGWSRTLNLVPITDFEGPSFSETIPVSLTELERFIYDLESRTGYLNPSFVVEIIPHVSFAGRVGSDAVSATSAPALQFRADLAVWQPILTEEAGLTRSTSGQVDDQSVVPATVTMLGTSLDVVALRWFSVALAAMSAALVAAAVFVPRLMPHDLDSDEERVRSDYGVVLVEAETAADTDTAVHTTSLDALAQLSAETGTPIVVTRNERAPVYRLRWQGADYRFSASGGSSFGQAS